MILGSVRGLIKLGWYPGVGNPVISVETEKVGDGPAAVIPIPSLWDNALTEKATVLSPEPVEGRRMGRRVKVGRVRKPGLDTLHEKVFEDKTVKGACG